MDNYVQLYKKSIEKCTKEQKKNYSNYDSIFQANGLNTMTINTNEYDRNIVQEQISAQSPVVHHRGSNSMYRHAIENNIVIDKKKVNTHASQPVTGLNLGRPKSHVIDKSQFPYKKTNVFQQNKDPDDQSSNFLSQLQLAENNFDEKIHMPKITAKENEFIRNSNIRRNDESHPK